MTPAPKRQFLPPQPSKMSLVEDFPEDPFSPSLRYAATCQIPVTLPWGREFIKLGSSLSVSRTGSKSSLDGSTSAFSQLALEKSRLVLTHGATGYVTAAETTGSSSWASHTEFSISGQVGGSFIGASGRASYEENALKNNSNIRSSFRTTYRTGSVRFLSDPPLSSHAISLLRSSKDWRKAEQAFRDVYGEYYVAAYILGGANATLLSGEAADEAFESHLKTSFTVTLAFWSYSDGFEEHETRAGAHGLASVAGYDSLDGLELSQEVRGSNGASYNGIITAGLTNKAKGNVLPKRVEEKAREIGLKRGTNRGEIVKWNSDICWAKCGELCKGGLVTELLLLPWSGLREYVEVCYGNM